MYILKKILSIEKQRTCFCGRSLVNNFCEVHGTEVKISMNIIHGQFEPIDTENKSKEPINLRLTENQFLNLFSKKDLENFNNTSYEYLILISQFDSNSNIKSIIDFFFNQIESDVFFRSNRFRETQITNSNIILNFLYSNEIIDFQTVKIQFNALVVRKLSDYINWRLNHFKAKPKNIINSLLGIRNTVYSENGDVCSIRDIEWNPKDTFPEKIIVQKKDTIGNLMEFPPSGLYQRRDDLQLNLKLENRIYSALRNFSQQFLNSLKHYLVEQSCLATFEKKNEIKTNNFKKLVGKTIKKSVNLADYSNE
ncbi:MAG: hypothetical protein FK730_08415 [Asgard group archaeon]|nr:hypothetical protein [Asgard group archaeon]